MYPSVVLEVLILSPTQPLAAQETLKPLALTHNLRIVPSFSKDSLPITRVRTSLAILKVSNSCRGWEKTAMLLDTFNRDSFRTSISATACRQRHIKVYIFLTSFSGRAEHAHSTGRMLQ